LNDRSVENLGRFACPRVCLAAKYKHITTTLLWLFVRGRSGKNGPWPIWRDILVTEAGSDPCFIRGGKQNVAHRSTCRLCTRWEENISETHAASEVSMIVGVGITFLYLLVWYSSLMM